MDEQEKAKEALVVAIAVPTSTSTKRCILGSVLLFMSVASSVTDAQLLAVGFALRQRNDTVAVDDVYTSALNNTRSPARMAFHAPYFYSLCRFLGRIFTLPTACFFAWLYSTIQRDPFSVKQYFIDSSAVASTGPEGVTFCGVLRKISLPTFWQIGIALGFIVALAYISPSIVQACLSGTVALSYILSIIFLKLRHSIIKTVFVLCAFSGIGMVTYATTTAPLSSTAYIGFIAVLIGAVSISFFQLSYKKAFPKISGPSQAAFTTSVTFCIGALVFWPVPLALKLSGIENWEFRDIPWGFLIGGVVAAVSQTFFQVYGLAMSDPFFMSLSEILRLVLNGVIDSFVRGVTLTDLQIGGMVVIGISFVVLILPDEYVRLPRLSMFRRITQSI